MGKSKNPNTYSDVKAVLDAAIAAGGEAVYDTGHYAIAIKWRARAYQFRLLLRDLAAQTLQPGLAPTTPYDHLVLLISKDDPTKVIITVRKPQGTLTTPDGKPIPVRPAASPFEQDKYQAEAEDLLKDLR